MTASDHPNENPFCSRRIRPGAVPFLFPANQTAEALVELLRKNQWWGEIIGPHGSGKSSLLASLIPAIERAGRLCLLIELHNGERQLPVQLDQEERLRRPAVVIVDGYEQLSCWNRFLLKRFCRRDRLGLLATSHVSVGLPQIFRTAVTPALAVSVVNVLLGDRPSPVSEAELAACLSRHGGNLRETLFELYDAYET